MISTIEKERGWPFFVVLDSLRWMRYWCCYAWSHWFWLSCEALLEYEEIWFYSTLVGINSQDYWLVDISNHNIVIHRYKVWSCTHVIVSPSVVGAQIDTILFKLGWNQFSKVLISKSNKLQRTISRRYKFQSFTPAFQSIVIEGPTYFWM